MIFEIDEEARGLAHGPPCLAFLGIVCYGRHDARRLYSLGVCYMAVGGLCVEAAVWLWASMAAADASSRPTQGAVFSEELS